MRIFRALPTLLASLILLPLLLHSANFFSGATACPVSGAATRIRSSSTPSSSWTVQTPSGNSGTIYLGGADISTTTGLALAKSTSFTQQPLGNSASFNLFNIWFLCSSSNDTITYVYVQ
jgi:hypothetical protein